MEPDGDGVVESPAIDRRPLKSRQWKLSEQAADLLIKAGASANGISVAGMVAGMGAGIALAGTSWAGVDNHGWVRALFVVSGLLIQVRLLANLLDGMVAIGSGKASLIGELFNETPDRVSDAAILIGAGYALGGHVVAGFVAAIMAIMTAYIRCLGKTMTGHYDFCGPMAKPQRMALMTGACLVCAAVPVAWWQARWIIPAALVIVILGSAFTCLRRLARIVNTLRERSSANG